MSLQSLQEKTFPVVQKTLVGEKKMENPTGRIEEEEEKNIEYRILNIELKPQRGDITSMAQSAMILWRNAL